MGSALVAEEAGSSPEGKVCTQADSSFPEATGSEVGNKRSEVDVRAGVARGEPLDWPQLYTFHCLHFLSRHQQDHVQEFGVL